MRRLLDVLRLRLRSLLRRSAVERELEEELRFHFDELRSELEAQGLSREEARRAARRRLGGPDQIGEAVRDTWRVRAVDDAAGDLRYGWRSLRRAPAFAVVSVLTLALGIGAATAIFSVVDAVLVRALPYPDSERIVMLTTRDANRDRLTPRLTGGDLVDLRASADTLEAVSFFWGGEIGVRGAGPAEITGTWFVTTDFFRVLGTPAAIGRTFGPDDVGRATVVTLGYAERQFGAASLALGRSLEIDGTSYEIVGVMPAGFRYPERADVWVPVRALPENLNRTAYNYPTIGRVRAGVPLDAVAAQLDAIAARLARQFPDSNKDKRFVAVPLHERTVGPIRATLFLLLASVGLLLLIGCANVANLLLARGSVRAGEIALRAALGASRWRIVRQLLVESLLLAALGGGLGIVLAAGGTELLVRLAPSDVPRLDEVQVDWRVVAFGAALSVAASLIFGLAPAWQAARADLRERLTQAGRGAAASGTPRARTMIAVAEIALAVVLATAAGLLFRSFVELSSVDMGFRSEGILVMDAHVPTTSLDEGRRAVERFERLFPELDAIPGVESVSATVGLPMSVIGSNGSYAVEGKHTFAPGQKLPHANFRLTSPGYFETMGVPLVRGRDFAPTDTYDTEFVAIISAALAAESFPNEDPIGKRVQCGLDSPEPMTIVGVVGDIREWPGDAPAPELYMPIAQHPGRGSLVQFVIRTLVPPDSVINPVRERVKSADARIATHFTTISDMTAEALATPRFRTWLVGVFACLAVLLAMAGVYGLMTYLTAQRLPELGVRLALGAHPARILVLVLRHASLLALAGLAAGCLLSLAAAQLLSSLLFGLGGFDALTFATVLGGVLVVSVGAAAVPAWRASRIDPLSVLRES